VIAEIAAGALLADRVKSTLHRSSRTYVN